MGRPKVVVLDIAGLSQAHLSSWERMPGISSLLAKGELVMMTPTFPALTLPVQASLTTGCSPSEHGVVANGFYFPENHQVSFWEQAASLVEAQRIWTRLAGMGRAVRTAALFLQNTMYSDCDVVITPRPLHRHDGGMTPWCYSKPVGLYEELAESAGAFPLHNYWGPMASLQSSSWIASSAVRVLEREKPDLSFIYLPHLDYCLQRLGPTHPGIMDELEAVDGEAGKVIDAARAVFGNDLILIVLSEYAFSSVHEAIPLNLFLRREGMLQVRNIGGADYLDIELSAAFALVDHQVAHVYAKPGQEKRVRTFLEKVCGIDAVIDREGQERYGVSHRRSGDFIAVSSRDRWFCYQWWENPATAPDFATAVDIHRKPGYDPLELLWDQTAMKISQDTSLVRGSHGYPATAAGDKVPFIISERGLLEHGNEVFTTATAGRFIESLLA